MSLLNRIFGQDVNENSNFWNSIETKENLEELFRQSHERPQIILKHSARCGISYMAKNSLDSISDETKAKADFSIIDVVGSRNISAYLTEKSGIRHESPQLMVVNDGAVSWHGSHYKVNANNLTEQLL